MTPAARVQTAIELLDPILAGAPAERVLTQWARNSRFAGSKDRAAVRDHVYDVLRQKNSVAQAGGGDTPRALMIGLLRLQGIDLGPIFTGSTYAPSELTENEKIVPNVEGAVDLPSWIVEDFKSSLGDRFVEIEKLLKDRAPVILRVNLRKSNVSNATSLLFADGVEVNKHPASETALIVTSGARQIRNSKAYREGHVELQDAASQAAIDLLPLEGCRRVLDYCAGGGGKLLAMAGRSKATFFAHDAHEARLRDLPDRAKRAGLRAEIVKTHELATQEPFDLVFCDVPCSGTGTWRRDPDAKWKLTEATLEDTLSIQQDILRKAADLVRPGGHLAYATCSLLDRENTDQISRFLADHPDWVLLYQQSWTPLEGCDGFFSACLQKPT